MTIIKSCDGANCKHDYQDKKYGKNNRVFNSLKEKTPQQYRCTICKQAK